MKKYDHPRTDLASLGPRSVLGVFVLFLILARTASATVVINEVQISPIAGRFIELYNPDSSSVDLTGWYIQRKTALSSSFTSLVTSTQMIGKSIKAGGYLLISRVQLGNSDVILDNFTLTESNTLRMRDSKGVDVDLVSWTAIDDGKSYQRSLKGDWTTGVPTPGATNETQSSTSAQYQEAVVSQYNTAITPATRTSNSSTFPVEPQIFADAGTAARTVSVGAPVLFTGRVWGLKKEPIENARMVWALGDGATAEGTTVSHIYYYPGEYTAVLDVASGYYAASDRVRVVAVAPSVALRAGGDSTRSFIAIENFGGDELDLSGWQIVAEGKTFVLPKNTLIGMRKILTIASEISGLAVSTSTIASLHFPNGTLVPSSSTSVAQIQQQQKEVNNKLAPISSTVTLPARSALRGSTQTASVATALDDTSGDLAPVAQESPLWMWYTGVALLGALGALGVRLSRKPAVAPSLADDFEIIEEDENTKSL